MVNAAYKLLGLIGAVALMCFMPVLVDSYVLNLLVVVMYTAYLAQAWNIMGGYAGQFSFGHAAFFGVGAYCVALAFVKWGISPWIGMWGGACIAVLMALVVGYLCFRYGLKGPYFVLATLAFAEAMRIICFNWKAVNGPLGLLLPLKPGAMNFQFASKAPYYYIALVMLIIITYITYRIARSKLGFYLVAVRENEDAAAALGVDTMRYKVLAVCLSGLFSAIGGAFYMQYYLYIDPTLAFGSDVSVTIMTPAIIGGVGTVAGPLIGAALVVPLGEITRTLFSGYSGLHLIVYGLLLILVVVFLPHGLLSLPSRLKGLGGRLGSRATQGERTGVIKSVQVGGRRD